MATFKPLMTITVVPRITDANDLMKALARARQYATYRQMLAEVFVTYEQFRSLAQETRTTWTAWWPEPIQGTLYGMKVTVKQ